MTMTDIGTDLTVAAHTFQPTAGAARQAMEIYQDISRALIRPEDEQVIGRTKFPKRSALQKLANAYRVSTEIVRDEIDYDDEGRMIRARITVRATHPDGRYTDGDGMCSIAEKGRAAADPKSEHDTHGTAVTRAKNRAIADLIAFGAVSAEEAEAETGPGGETRGASPAWAELVGDSTVQKVAPALVSLFGAAGVTDPADRVMEVGQAIFDAYGGMPACVADSLLLVARMVTDRPVEAAPEPAEAQSDPDPSQDTTDTQETA